MILSVITVLLFGLISVLAVPVFYLLVLTAFAYRAQRHTQYLPENSKTSFAFLIPAHNEESLLPTCLASLNTLDYPRQLFDISVVADNCTDQTAALAEGQGAAVFVREDPDRRGKPYALKFGLDHLWKSGRVYDAVIILDADSIVSPDFLKVMAAHIQRGERVIQSFYIVRNPERSWSESLRFAALAAVHFLRPLARSVTGGSVGLKGNGMVFAPDLLKRYPWSLSLTEDIEYHMTLLFAGERVTFAPDALVYGEMPASLGRSSSQHDRWERGRLEAAKTYLPRLFKAGMHELRTGNFRKAYLYWDAALEHLIPPFSILVGLTGVVFLASAALLVVSLRFGWVTAQMTGWAQVGFWLSQVNFWLSLCLVIGQIVYVLSSLKLARAPWVVYRALLYAPLLVVWKIIQYIRVLLEKNRHQWVRTARNEG